MRWAGAIRRNRRLRAGKRIARSESIVYGSGLKSIGRAPLNSSELRGEHSSALHAVQKEARLSLIAAVCSDTKTIVTEDCLIHSRMPHLMHSVFSLSDGLFNHPFDMNRRRIPASRREGLIQRNPPVIERGSPHLTFPLTNIFSVN